MLRDLRTGRTAGKPIYGLGDRKLKEPSSNIKQEV